MDRLLPNAQVNRSLNREPNQISRMSLKTSESRRTTTQNVLGASNSQVQLKRQQSKRGSVNVVIKQTPSSKLANSNSGQENSQNQTKTFFEKDSEKTLKKFLQGDSRKSE